MKKVGDLLREKFGDFRAHTKPDDGIRCMEGTSTELLEDAKSWIAGGRSSSSRLYCLAGHAGSGKSTIARSVADNLTEAEKTYSATFYFSLSNNSRIRDLFPWLAYQLAVVTPGFCKALVGILEAAGAPDQTKSSEELLQKLVVEPLSNCSFEDISQQIIIMIDALDECGDEREMLIPLFAQAVKKVNRIPLRLFLTTRPDDAVTYDLKENTTLLNARVFKIGEANKEAKNDIREYFKKEIDLKRGRLRLPGDWPTEDDLDLLRGLANGLWIYASTLLKAMLDGIILYTDIQDGKLPRTEKVDTLYSLILSKAYASKESAEVQEAFHTTLSIAFRSRESRLSIQDMAYLVFHSKEKANEIRRLLIGCASVLDIPDLDDEGTITVYHATFQDYCTRKEIPP